MHRSDQFNYSDPTKFQVVKEHYHFASINATIRVSFEHSEITLNIPDAGLMIEGWKITPFTHPTVSEAWATSEQTMHE